MPNNNKMFHNDHKTMSIHNLVPCYFCIYDLPQKKVVHFAKVNSFFYMKSPLFESFYIVKMKKIYS